jgi:hypothetical protein
VKGDQVKITKELCANALQVLTAEGKRRKDGWLGVLNEITDEQPYRESVANLVHMVLCNSPAFMIAAQQNLQKYMADHPEIRQPELALQSLLTQLAVRLIVYTLKHTEESVELQEMFDMTERKEDM